jgi:hypothetical protein
MFIYLSSAPSQARISRPNVTRRPSSCLVPALSFPQNLSPASSRDWGNTCGRFSAWLFLPSRLRECARAPPHSSLIRRRLRAITRRHPVITRHRRATPRQRPMSLHRRSRIATNHCRPAMFLPQAELPVTIATSLAARSSHPILIAKARAIRRRAIIRRPAYRNVVRPSKACRRTTSPSKGRANNYRRSFNASSSIT